MGLGAGQIVYAADMSGLRPGVYFKGGSTTRNNTTTMVDDPDLSNIPLDPGYYAIALVVYVTNANAAAKFKMNWAFTGSWSAPLRKCFGPGTTNTAAPTVATPSQFDGNQGDSLYSLGVSATWAAIEETCDRVEILSAGNLSLQWAQSVATVADTIVRVGNFRVTKVDDL